MDHQNENRREFTRVPLPFPVRARSGSRVVRVDGGVDVSAKGVLLESAESLPVGETCVVEISLAEGFVIEAQGVVVRARDGRFAVEFTSIDADGFELLKNLVRYNAEDPADVDREFAAHLGLLKR